jgi:hypothetical protein
MTGVVKAKRASFRRLSLLCRCTSWIPWVGFFGHKAPGKDICIEPPAHDNAPSILTYRAFNTQRQVRDL